MENLMEEMTKNEQIKRIAPTGGQYWTERRWFDHKTGIFRKYFQALEFLKGRMQELGMQVETDPVGNLHGVLQGSDPAAKSIVLGSHMDTVMQGGVYDGMLGVTGALEVAARLKDEGRTLRHPLEIWGFNMEESSILGGTFGSRCVTGMLDPDIPGYAEKISKVWLQSGKSKSRKERYQQV